MLQHTMRFFALLGLLALSACSDDPTAPIGLPDQSGSGSMNVSAEVSGSDAGAGLFQTDYTITISDSLGAPINTAVVTISHAVHGVDTIPWSGVTPGEYTASVNSYEPGTYTLNITSGAEFLFNARVVGPDVHEITYPALTDTIPLNTEITTLWTRTAAAQLVEVETRDYGPALSSSVGDTDDGSFRIPGSSTVRDDQRVRITRSNTTILTGARSGSTLTAEIRNSVEPLVQL